MRNPPFNPLAYVRKLEEAGVGRQQAEIHAEAFQLFEITQEAVIREDLVTKSDLEHALNKLASELRLENERTRTDLLQPISDGKSELQQEFGKGISETRLEVERTRTELRQEIADVKSELQQEFGKGISETRLEGERTRTELRQEMADVKSELQQEFGKGISETRLEVERTRTELRREMADVKSELQQEIHGVKTELIKWIVGLILAQTTLFFAVLGYLATWLGKQPAP